jgi:hypothetical protein
MDDNVSKEPSKNPRKLGLFSILKRAMTEMFSTEPQESTRRNEA